MKIENPSRFKKQTAKKFFFAVCFLFLSKKTMCYVGVEKNVALVLISLSVVVRWLVNFVNLNETNLMF